MPIWADLFFLYFNIGPNNNKTKINPPKKNKKSAESDVAPAGIKSYKFLFVLKKIYFTVFKKLIGKMDKVENLEYWLAKFYLNLSIISQDIDIERISFLPILGL